MDLQTVACGRRLTLLDIGAGEFTVCVGYTDAYATDPQIDALQAKGLHIVQAFDTDLDGNPPTTDFCSSYAADHAVDFDFLVDPLAETSTIALAHPDSYVIDSAARIVLHGLPLAPEDQVAILDELLEAAP